MKETVYIMVLVDVQSTHNNISDTVHELENEAVLTITNTKNLHILRTEILLTRVRNLKK